MKRQEATDAAMVDKTLGSSKDTNELLVRTAKTVRRIVYCTLGPFLVGYLLREYNCLVFAVPFVSFSILLLFMSMMIRRLADPLRCSYGQILLLGSACGLSLAIGSCYLRYNSSGYLPQVAPAALALPLDGWAHYMHLIHTACVLFLFQQLAEQIPRLALSGALLAALCLFTMRRARIARIIR